MFIIRITEFNTIGEYCQVVEAKKTQKKGTKRKLVPDREKSSDTWSKYRAYTTSGGRDSALKAGSVGSYTMYVVTAVGAL